MVYFPNCEWTVGDPRTTNLQLTLVGLPPFVKFPVTGAWEHSGRNSCKNVSDITASDLLCNVGNEDTDLLWVVAESSG
jgi:hypothetical protein